MDGTNCQKLSQIYILSCFEQISNCVKSYFLSIVVLYLRLYITLNLYDGLHLSTKKYTYLDYTHMTQCK